MEKLLVTQALNELTLLDDRIINKIARSKFVTSAKTVESKITPYLTKEEFVKKARGGYDSVNALIERHTKIKAAVMALLFGKLNAAFSVRLKRVFQST